MKPFITVALILVLCMLSAGCSQSNEYSTFEKDKTYKLKVMAYNEDSLSQYGDYINEAFPNVELEVVPVDQIIESGSWKERLLPLVDSEQPDLFIGLFPFLYDELQENNRLLPLQGVLGKTALNDLHPGLKELEQHYGDGELYKVPVAFSADVLYYNKDLFNKLGITAPTEAMKWEDFTQLTRRFAGTDSLGLYMAYSDPGSFFRQIGTSKGLSYIDQGMDKVTLNTDSWAGIANMLKSMYAEGVINGWDSPDEEDPFIQGTAAMTLDEASYSVQLETEGVPFEWGILPAPNDDLSLLRFYPDKLVAINNSSEHQDDAIKLIRFLLSSQMANIIYETQSLMPSSLQSTINQDNTNLFHFMYERQADITAIENDGRMDNMSAEFHSLFTETIKAMMSSKVEIREGLERIEDAGNEELR